MTVKEFLGQAYLLDQRIRSHTLQCEELRQTAQSISSPCFEEHYNASKNTDAAYIKTLDRLWEMEEKVMTEMAELVELKGQISDVIGQIDRPEEQTVLRYRYIHNYTWPRIADLVNADETTVRRWHNKATAKIRLPENAINLKSARFCM